MTEETMQLYWREYDDGYRVISSSDGYQCFNCGAWVYGDYHACPIYTPNFNKKEKAFEIVKILVEMKAISEPDYKGFCELIEKIANKI